MCPGPSGSDPRAADPDACSGNRSTAREERISETLWHVTLDRVPLEGRHDRAQAQALIGEYPGRTLPVWKEGMEGWGDPRRLPDFEADAFSPHPSRTTAPPDEADSRPDGRIFPGLDGFPLRTIHHPPGAWGFYTAC